MIYKIQSNSDKMFDLFEKISKTHNLIFTNNILYVAPNSLNSPDIRRIFVPKKDFFITEINENNLIYETVSVKEWVKNQSISIEVMKIERDKQIEIQEDIKFLELFQEEINELKREEERNGRN